MYKRSCCVVIVFAIVSIICVLHNVVFAQKPRPKIVHTERPSRLSSELIRAAANGDAIKVKSLLKRGADVNATDEDGWSPLRHAVEGSHAAVVKALILANTKLDSRDEKFGFSPLMMAASIGNGKVVNLLIQAGADPRFKDNLGRTPLVSAAKSGNVEIIRALLKAGADPKTEDMEGSTALVWAAEAGQVEAIQLLIESGTPVNSRDKKGKTPIMWAAEWGHAAAVKALIEAGADCNNKTVDGDSVLTLAAEYGHTEALRVLYEAGADVNSIRNERQRVLVRRLLINVAAQIRLEKSTAEIPDFITPRLVVQTGHALETRTVAYSTDGRFALSGSDDGTIKLWDVLGGSEIRAFPIRRGIVLSVAFSSDGLSALAGGGDEREGFLQKWDLATGQLLWSVRASDRAVIAIASIRAKRWVVAGGQEGVSIWDEVTGNQVRNLADSPEAIHSVAVSPDNKYIAGGGSDGDGTLEIWDIAEWRHLSIDTKAESVESLAFSQDSKFLLTGHSNGALKLWRVPRGNLVKIYQSAGNSIYSVAFSNDGPYFAVGKGGCSVNCEKAGSIELWDFTLHKKLAQFGGHTRAVTSLSFGPRNSQKLISASEDTTLKLWLTPSGRCLLTFSGIVSPVTSLALSHDNHYLVSGYRDGSLRIWDLLKGQEIKRPIRYDEPVENDRSFAIYGRILNRVQRDRAVGAVTALAVAPDNADFVSMRDDGLIRRWQLSTGEEAGTFPGSRHAAKLGEKNIYLTYVDQQHIISGMRNDLTKRWDLKVWDSNSREFLTSIERETLKGFDLFIFPLDNSKAFVASGGTVQCIDNKTGVVTSLVGHADAITSLALSREGRYLLTGSDDTTAKLWDIAAGKEIQTFVGHSFGVSSVALSDDSRYAFSGSQDGTIKIWKTQVGQPNDLPTENDSIDRVDGLSTREVCSLVRFKDESVVTVGLNGQFDTESLEEMSGLRWTFADSPLSAMPLEIFMRDFYRPDLLRRSLKGSSNSSVRTELASINRTQPKIEKISVASRPNQSQLVDVTVLVSSTAGRCLQQAKFIPCESGVYDLRLYRDGQLVQQSPAANETTTNLAGADWRQQLQQWRPASLVKNKEGKAVTVATGPQEVTFTDIQLPKRAGVSQVEFTAYAFNEDRVKSATSKPAVYLLPQPRPGAPRRAFLITVGVDVTSAGWRLRFARKGVTEIQGLLQKSLGDQQYQVVPVQLLSAYQKNSADLVNLATKRNIQTVLSILSGRDMAKAEREKIPQQEQLQSATPDDLVMIYIASHGYVDPGGKFYMMPSDIGPPLGVSEESLDRCLKNNEQSPDCDNARRLLGHSITSEELTQWIEAVDAGQMVLILDSCHSGAVSGPDFKPGPMGDRSFGQLSYDKGMLVLAASQANQLDTGTLKLGHRSLLTYALTQQKTPIQSLDLRQWLSEAERQVPKLYRQFVKSESTLTSANESDNQEPALFDFSKRKRKPTQTH